MDHTNIVGCSTKVPATIWVNMHVFNINTPRKLQQKRTKNKNEEK